MISIENLSKSFGARLLFDSISFKINRRERVGLVGRNGHGKTTLFRIIAGLESADSGSVSIPKNYRIGYVEQEPVFKESTVLAEAILGLPPAERDRTWRAEKILAGLGFETRELRRPPAELSGGFQVRLNLAKVLLADFDMLLLDEPNNYLDVTSIRWLERFLRSWPGEFLIITHDRSFMDSVVTHIIGIHRRKVRKLAGDTGKYYAQIAQDEEIYEKTRLNDERKRKEIQNFIDKFRASAQLTGLVQSRIKTLSKMEKREKLEKIATLDFRFASKPYHGKYALNLDEVHFSYDPARPLIRDFSVTVGARDRICVIGRNGRGKSTLLKLMAGVLEPQAGEVSRPINVATGYFEQSYVSGLDESRTVLDEIMTADPERDPGRSRAICGGMLFDQDEALKKIGLLSGGEKSRVVLGKLIAAPYNLLLLDEPSNHLDMESNDALLAALDNFEGAVVMATHNEMFLHALAERLIVFQADRIVVYEGDYQRFLERVGWQEEADGPRPEKSKDRERPSQRDLRRLRSAVISERARALRPLEKRADEAEAEIEAKEAELESLNRAIIEASGDRPGQEIVEITRRMHRLKKEVDFLYGELETLTRDIEEKKAHFDRELAGLTS